jgi:hypothetical protein
MSAKSGESDDLTTLWRQQLVTPLTLSAAELRAEHRSLRRKVRSWLLLEYVSCAAVVAAFINHWIFAENRVSHFTCVAFIAAQLCGSCAGCMPI